jgi:hypothetical protein
MEYHIQTRVVKPEGILGVVGKNVPTTTSM